MSKYVIFKSGTHEVPNEVYFVYDLEGAISAKDRLNSEGNASWDVAEILDERKWYVKFLFWLGRKVNEADKG